MVTRVSSRAATDAGLARHMTQVFNYMTGGVALSALTAWFMMTFNGGQLMMAVLQNGLAIPLMLVQLGVVFFLSFRIHAIQPKTGLMLFGAYSALTGVSLAPITLMYTSASIVQAFLVAAGMFAAMAFWGYTTKKSLSGLGTFLFMGVIGLVIASVINMFMQSSQMSFFISLIGVPLFAGLTAYDTQKVKDLYYQVGNDEAERTRGVIMGALSLYIDFINMFLMLLRLMGQSRD